VIALAVVAVYEPVRGFAFVVYDDKQGLLEDTALTGGLTREGLVRAFNEPYMGNYVPLTVLSHMLDMELFGLDAGGHHVVNALLHVAASLLLFEALRRMSGDLLPSLFVALVFAIHPTHVESVAWISERRDTLSGLLWMLTLLAYGSFVRARSHRVARYALVMACLALGLLAKPMLVTLPVVLLLLDAWPLRRGSEGIGHLLLEKLPLLLLAVLASAAASWAQQEAGALASLNQVPLQARVSNALVSGVAYLGLTLWPAGLAVFHPFELEIPLWKSAGAALLLLALSALAVGQSGRRPYLGVGWLWYLVTLAPVIGVVQVGSQGLAERYLYLPMIGLAIAGAWLGAELAARGPTARRIAVAAALVWLGFCLPLARAQVATWRDSVALFEHARAVVGDHPVVLVNLGEAYDDAGDTRRAIEFYQAGLEGFPHAPHARARLGALLARSGRSSEAGRALIESIQRHPEERGTRLELGRLLLQTGQLEAAAEQLEAERALDPGNPHVPFHLAELAAANARREEALALFGEALALDPALPNALILDKSAWVCDALAEALARAGSEEQALRWARRALTLARLGGDEALAARLTGAWPALGNAPGAAGGGP
jgi:tetratricopeptide (TPR) repeat protein